MKEREIMGREMKGMGDKGTELRAMAKGKKGKWDVRSTLKEFVKREDSLYTSRYRRGFDFTLRKHHFGTLAYSRGHLNILYCTFLSRGAGVWTRDEVRRGTGIRDHIRGHIRTTRYRPGG